MAASASSISYVQKMYIAYFGRPAAPTGLEYYAQLVDAGNKGAVADDFWNSAESQSIYGGLSTEARVNAIFQQLFGRDAAVSGLTYWTLAINSGAVGLPTAALTILNSAGAADLAAFNAKLSVADAFTSELESSTQNILGYQSNTDGGRDLLSSIKTSAQSQTAIANIATTVESIAAEGSATSGSTFTLTTDADSFKTTSLTATDKLVGILDYDGTDENSTWSVGDTFQGNGKTTFTLLVQDIDGTSYNSPFASTIGGIDKLQISNNDSGAFPELNIDGSSLGSQLSMISLAGEDGLCVTVSDLAATGDFSVQIAGATTGTVEFDGKLGNLNACACLYNSDNDSIGGSMTFGVGSISMVLGAYDIGCVILSQSETSAKANVSVGSITIGDVTADVGGSSAYATVSIYNYASAVNHNASVGNITVGDVSYSGTAYSGYLCISNYAYASAAKSSASATAGNISIGNINGINTDDCYFCVDIYNAASVGGSKNGTATVGNISVGNVSLSSGGDVNFFITNSASNAGVGNAVAGNITLGDVSSVNSSSTACLYVNNWAFADKGNATVGDITVGNVNLEALNTYACMFICASATVTATGNATVGNITVGDVSLLASDSSACMFITAYACADKGNAKVGNVTVGNVSLTADYTACLSIGVSATVDKAGSATVGNITIGNLSLLAVQDEDAAFYIDHLACVTAAATQAGGSATVGNILIGDISMIVEDSDAYVEISQIAYLESSKSANVATVGNLTIGNISMGQNAGDGGEYNCIYINRSAENDDAGGSASAGNIVIGDITINTAILQNDITNAITIYNCADSTSGAATVGSITIGNITGQTGASGVLCVYVSNYASGDGGKDSSGLVKIGNVAMSAVGDADMTLSVFNYADEGTVGGIQLGNIAMCASKATGSAYLSISQTGDTGSNITIGNIGILAKTANLFIYNEADENNGGNIKVGNISIKAVNAGTAQDNYISNWVSTGAGNGGTVTVGDVTLTAGKGADNFLDIFNRAADGTVGNVTIGNVVLNVTASKSATVADAGFGVLTNSGKTSNGNITVGNITINAKGASTKVNAGGDDFVDGYISLTSTDGTVTVGNITVTGGVITKDSKSDGFDVLTEWLTLSGSTKTIGNVDYGGYAGIDKGATVIDVSGLKGAAEIKGATGGATIKDNTGTNAITLNGSSKADYVYIADNQSAVTNTLADTADLVVDQTKIDTIANFGTSDRLYFTTGAVDNNNLLTGSSLGTLASFTAFLRAAELAIESDGAGGNTVSWAKIGSDTFLAVGDADGVEAIIKLTGVAAIQVNGNDYIEIV